LPAIEQPLNGLILLLRSALLFVCYLSRSVQVASGAMVAAGAVLEPGAAVASGELWAGNPARKLRELKQEEIDYLQSLPGR
jgi:carbonic anhydrase/acetyltransferase-like protein (isoleucine patch superfamily)